MLRAIVGATLSVSLLAITPVVSAESLTLSAPAQANQATADNNRSTAGTVPSTMPPSRGQSMKSVLSQFGKPVQESGPVGDPPITRWGYDQFVVFFEYDKVIRAVLPSAPPKLYHAEELQAAK